MVINVVIMLPKSMDVADAVFKPASELYKGCASFRARFQDPGELLKAIPTIAERIETGRRITREGLHKMPPAA